VLILAPEVERFRFCSLFRKIWRIFFCTNVTFSKVFNFRRLIFTATINKHTCFEFSTMLPITKETIQWTICTYSCHCQAQLGFKRDQVPSRFLLFYTNIYGIFLRKTVKLLAFSLFISKEIVNNQVALIKEASYCVVAIKYVKWFIILDFITKVVGHFIIELQTIIIQVLLLAIQNHSFGLILWSFEIPKMLH
jgi:hypothetical protein